MRWNNFAKILFRGSSYNGSKCHLIYLKTIFTPKLGWNLMIKIDILYDRIIIAKYNYANLSILDIHLESKILTCWGITNH